MDALRRNRCLEADFVAYRDLLRTQRLVKPNGENARYSIDRYVAKENYVFILKQLQRAQVFCEQVKPGRSKHVESYEIGISRQDMEPSYLDGTEHINLGAKG